MTKTTQEPVGIGGWLILPIIGLIITIIRCGFLIATVFIPIFTEGAWAKLTTVGSPLYHPLWAPLLIFEVLGNLFFAIAAVILLILLFSKHPLFPKLIIAYFVANLIFVGSDYFLVHLIPLVAKSGSDAALTEFSRAFVAALIWIPYFLKSKRVKNTFVKKQIESACVGNP